MEAPENWLKMVENIRKVRKLFPAPVDSMGCDQVYTRADKSAEQRFQILTSLMLSSQTKDPITFAATQKLRQAGLGRVAGVLGATEKDIEDLIHPVGFYRRKAVYLKKVAQILNDQYQGDIPDSLEGLCSLPGVGPKMAHLCMQEAWNVNSGIGVDTHVHRISARLGWVPSKGIKTPEQTREALESWLPREHWREINHLLVGFGQTICTPLRPKCELCANSAICPSSTSKTKNANSGPVINKSPKNKQSRTKGTKLEATEQEASDEQEQATVRQEERFKEIKDGRAVKLEPVENEEHGPENQRAEMVAAATALEIERMSRSSSRLAATVAAGASGPGLALVATPNENPRKKIKEERKPMIEDSTEEVVGLGNRRRMRRR